MIDISTVVGIVSVPKRSTLDTSRRKLSEEVSFGVGTLFFVVEQSSLENAPGGCDPYRRIYTVVFPGLFFLLFALLAQLSPFRNADQRLCHSPRSLFSFLATLLATELQCCTRQRRYHIFLGIFLRGRM